MAGGSMKLTEKAVGSANVESYVLVTQMELPFDYVITGNEEEGELDAMKIESVRRIPTAQMVEMIQDNLEIDDEPTDESDALITSGSVKAELDRIDEALDSYNEDITNIKSVALSVKSIDPVETDLSASLTYTTGFVNTTGYIDTSSSNYMHTEKLAVQEGDVWKTLYKYTAWRFVCAYDGDTVVSASGAENVYEYTVPAGVTHIIITLYSEVSTASKAVVRYRGTPTYINSAMPYIEELQDEKMSEPETAGTSGQVLTADGNGGCSWSDPPASVEIDATLTQEGKAADAKAVGDQITKIKDAAIYVEEIDENTDISMSLTYTADRYCNMSGYIGTDSTSYKITEKIPVTEGMRFYTTYQTDWRYVCAFNGDTAVSDKGAQNTKEYTVPAGITHIIITLYSNVSTASRAVFRQFSGEIWHNGLEADMAAETAARTSADIAMQDQIDGIESATVSTQTYSKEIDLSASIEYTTSQYCNTTGYIGGDSNYTRTAKIPVAEGDVYKTTYQTNWRYVCAYNGDTAVSDKGAQNVTTYTVPAGVTHIIITLYSSVSRTNRAIIKVEDFTQYDNSASVINPNFIQRKPRVTIIDDDGYEEFYTYFYPLMTQYNVPMVSAYMGDFVPTFNRTGYMTAQQCQDVVDAGGEIVVHGGTNLTNMTLAQAEANVVASQRALIAHGFADGADIYVYPNSGNNIEIREMMARHFKCAFKTGYPQKGDNRVNDKCVPSYFIHRCSAGGYYDDKSAQYGNYDTHTLNYFKALIDDAVAKNGWLVLMTHAWMMPVGCSYRLEHDAANGIPADLDEFALLGDIIEYVQTLKAGGTDIEIVTASEGFKMFGNEMQSGDYLGYWNETYTSQDISQYWHDKAGFAVNKLGEVDFADGNRISHS